MLVIKKVPAVTIKNEIGRLFKTHSVLEFKILEGYGVVADEKYNGIYYLRGNTLFDTQIVSTQP